ncbi:MAG TPA: EamA family transporter [Candidatus Tectomicrobia bacterium]|nr:EamA family transporter [Candidatus Tectomicrobia bacterium]
MWFGLALLSALFQVLRNMSMKHLGRSLDDTINVWGRFTFLLPFTAGFVLWQGIPPLQPGFWPYVVLFGVSQTAATLSLAKALRLSDISIVTALWKLSLLFLVVFAFLSLGEKPSLLGLVGILVSLVGVYLLNMQKSRVSVWAPVHELFVDRGLRYTLLSAALYAPTVVLIKQIIVRSDAYFANLMAYLAASLVILPLVLRRSAKHFAQIPRHWPSFVGMGLFACLASVCHSLAYQLTLTSYVEAAKQAEVLFALGIGALVFQERARVRAILPGSLIILLGMILLHLSG